MAAPDHKLALMQLKILWHKLDDEGLHVRANNVAHAMAVIETLAATRADVIEECSKEIEATAGWVNAHDGWPSSMDEYAVFFANAVRDLKDYK